MSNARKLFRILKSLMEYQKLMVVLGKADKMALHKLILAIIPRVAYFLYWIIDTLVVLTKIKFTSRWDIKDLMYKWATLWTIANVFTIIGAIVELVELGKEEAKMIASRKYSKTSDDAKDNSNGQVDQFKQKKFAQKLIVIKCSGDLITSTQNMGLPKDYLGWEFHDGMIGCGGFTSAAISCYNQYKLVNK